jgi:thiazole/oxazole-forming peptide maturase SagD family component
MPTPVCVDDVLTPDAVDGLETDRGKHLFILVDVNRLILYRNTSACERPNVMDVIEYIREDHALWRAGLPRESFPDNRCPFVHDAKILRFFREYWEKLPDGRVIVLDFQTGEIRSALACHHPTVGKPRLPRLNDTTTELVTGLDAGRGSPLKANFEGLVSRDIGPIGFESLTATDAHIPSARVRLMSRHGLDGVFPGGTSNYAETAEHVARCEALEWFHVMHTNPAEDLTYAAYEQIRDNRAIHPADLCFCRTSKVPRAALGSVPMYWTTCRHSISGSTHMVPAQEIWFDTSRLSGERRLIVTTTSGCALGTSFEDAALGATLELVERDAYLTMWYLRRSPKQVDPATVACRDFQLLWARVSYSFPAYRFYILDIRAGLAIPAIAIVAVRMHGEGAKTFHTSAAHLSVTRAMLKALQDIARQLKPNATNVARSADLFQRPGDVESIEDHVTLFAGDEMFEKLNFLHLDSSEYVAHETIQEEFDEIVAGTGGGKLLRKVASHLEAAGLPLYLKELTYSWHIDRNLRCARAIIPGAYPMWFGTGSRRFRLTPRLQKLALAFGHPVPIRDDELNLEPHPFG